MRKLLNTLFVAKPEAYLSLEGETLVVQAEGDRLLQLPLHTLEGIVYFGYSGASPALMGECAKRKIQLSFHSRNGRFLAAVVGENDGNVLLRREQYRIADDQGRSMELARSFITAKIYNGYHLLDRTRRDHALRVDTEALIRSRERMRSLMLMAQSSSDAGQLRGFEGEAAESYFSVFNEHILQSKEDFVFAGRSRRPPRDRVNALLSFAYSLLTSDCKAALRSVGLDPYVGFLHCDRSGRASLALDLMEELRSVLADRFVLSLINTRVIAPERFAIGEDSSVLLDDVGRRTFLAVWQERKQEELQHSFLKEKVSWGLVPYVQALLLARFIRGDLNAYPPFFWRQ